MFENLTSHSVFRSSIRLKSLAASTLAATLMLFSCEKDDTLSDHQVTTEVTTLNRLLAMGFKQDFIVDKGDFYIVEGDIRFDKVTAKQPSTRPGTVIQQQSQAHTNNLINPSINDGYISVGFDSSFPVSWQDEAYSALAEWNSLQGKSLKFVWVDPAYADIVVRSQHLSGNLIGLAEFPSNGRPGHNVWIDPDVTQKLLKLVLVHEFGHCFGLRHTDLYQNGEGAGTDGGHIIYETPNLDNTSIMLSGYSPYFPSEWTRLSNYDVIAIQNMYPVFMSPERYQPGTFVKIEVQSTMQALTVEGAALWSGAPIIQYPYSDNGVGNDEWSLQPGSFGGIKIIARNSGLALAVGSNGELIQRPYQAITDDWEIQEVGVGNFKIRSWSTGQSASVARNSNAYNARIVHSLYGGYINQRWYITVVN